MIPQILSIASLFEAFSFDMLQAMVEEMNRYGESPLQVLKYLNVRPEFASGSWYNIRLLVDGKQLPQRKIIGDQWEGNPLVSTVRVEFEEPRSGSKSVDEDDNDDGDCHSRYTKIEFTADEIDLMDTSSGILEYWNEEQEVRMILQKDARGDVRRGRTGDSNGSFIENFTRLSSSSQLGETDASQSSIAQIPSKF